MEELQPKLSEILQAKRKRLQMTFEDFAKLCGVSVRTAKSMEYGEAVRLKTARQVLETIGYRVEVKVEIWKDRE